MCIGSHCRVLPTRCCCAGLRARRRTNRSACWHALRRRVARAWRRPRRRCSVSSLRGNTRSDAETLPRALHTRTATRAPPHAHRTRVCACARGADNPPPPPPLTQALRVAERASTGRSDAAWRALCVILYGATGGFTLSQKQNWKRRQVSSPPSQLTRHHTGVHRHVARHRAAHSQARASALPRAHTICRQPFGCRRYFGGG